MSKSRLLFLIILVEGYVVLACELLAIRQLIPFVGSGTETVSIIISAVLLPLAVGYHCGGRAFASAFAKAKKSGKQLHSVRSLLVRNLLTALAILGIGLSYPILELFFGRLEELGIHHRLTQTALYSALFLVTPIFLLGQTVPLVSHYFSRARLSEITGRMLFFSTTGSFLGSIFSTIVLMSTIGVHLTVIVTLWLTGVLALLINGRRINFESVTCVVLMAAVGFFNSGAMMRSFGIVSNNAYNMVSINKTDDAKVMIVNRSASSMLGSGAKKRFDYVDYIERNILAPLAAETTPRSILVIGAGGFTIGLDDTRNRYIFVDIDPALKDVSEKHFLPSPLTANKQFAAASARAFVRGDTQRYDVIVIDTYTNSIAIPMECTTREFLLDVKKLLKPDGVLLVNVISTPDFRDRFTMRYTHTFASVFPGYTRQIIGDFNPWREIRGDMKATRAAQRNVLFMYFNRKGMDEPVVYTDDRNTYSLDRD